ncbi:MAG: glycosyl hydrolase [Opitutaceae bacterium]
MTPQPPRYLAVMVVLLSLLLSFCQGQPAADPVKPAVSPAPVDAKAAPRVRSLLAYLQSLETRTEKRLLTGQFCGFGKGATVATAERIYTATGEHPAFIGVDYGSFEGRTLETRIPNQVALSYWRSGGWVTVSVHGFNPANPKDYGLRDNGVKLDDLIRPGTPTHVSWMHQIDQMAEGLQELQDAGVVVLWRPFHEMNGGWFWWGAKEPAAFVRVWRHLYHTLTEVKKLHNLLWVYGPNHAANAAAYYPGDAYVDLIGLDAYTDHVDPSHIRGYPDMAAIQKPYGFTEFGPHGSKNPPGDFDYRRLIAGVKEHFPRTTHILTWDDNWSPAKNRFAREYYAHPWMVNRDDLPALDAPAP